jgi:hypothetical protein
MRTTTHPLPPARRVKRFLLVGGMTAVIALGTAACGGGDDSDAKQASATSTTVAASTTPTNSQASSGGSNNQGGGTQSGGGGGGGNSSPAPTIDSFQTPDNIDCHNGDFQMFTASWSTSNAVKVTISIDGPGVYKTYDGPSGSDSLPFNCSSSHSFLLTAYGADGQTATQTITLEPRNVQSTTTSQP